MQKQFFTRFSIVLILMVTFFLFGCASSDSDGGGSSSTAGEDWTQATASMGQSDFSYEKLLVHDGKLWAIGRNETAGSYANDVWNSSDGITWTKVADTADFAPRHQFGFLSFDDKMWVIAGEEADGEGAYNDVWSSTDGATWTEATSDAGFYKRREPGSVVFNDKMWIIGGESDGTSDVWSSSDGVNWSQATSNTGFSYRLVHMSLVFDDKMWVIGGHGGSGTDESLYNDVWYSSDGATWTQATDEAAFEERGYHAVLAYNNKMWVIGGLIEPTTDDYEAVNDVYSSTDGITWTQVTGSAAFSARGAQGAAVFNNQMWILGGSDLTNNLYDVWYSP